MELRLEKLDEECVELRKKVFLDCILEFVCFKLLLFVDTVLSLFYWNTLVVPKSSTR